MEDMLQSTRRACTLLYLRQCLGNEVMQGCGVSCRNVVGRKQVPVQRRIRRWGRFKENSKIEWSAVMLGFCGDLVVDWELPWKQDSYMYIYCNKLQLHE